VTVTTDTSGERIRDLLSDAPRAGARMDVRDFLRLLHRRKWHIVGVTALVVAVTGLVLAQLTPEYRATALVMLDTRKAKVTNTMDVLGGLATDASGLQTEIEILRSAALLGRAVDKLKLDQEPEFGEPETSYIGSLIGSARLFVDDLLMGKREAPPAPTAAPIDPRRSRAIAYIARNLTIVTRGRSLVIAVSFDSTSPLRAKRIVDAVTDAYIVDQLNAKFEANKRATEWLDERLSELRRNVEAAERAVASFREKAGLTVGKDTTVIVQSLTEFNSQLIQARAQLADKESRLVALERAQRDPASLGGLTEVMSNPLISALRAQEAEVSRRAADLGQRYGDSHPRLLQTRAELGQIQARIAAEVGKIIGSVRSDAEAARSKEAQMRSQVDQLEKQAGDLGQSGTELRQLDREAQSNRAVYEDFLKRFKELREQQDIQQPDARILSAAALPTSPIYPRYGLTLALALGVGLLLGAALVAIMERLDGGFRNGDQIEKFTGHATVGMIPALSRMTLGKTKPARWAIEKSASAYGEALRSTYTAITLGMLDKPPRVIMVTSSLPDEGKSTFACSLAGLLAKSNPDKKFVLVDCDFRRSSLLGTLGVPPTNGTIDEYLSGAKTLEEVVGRDEHSGLYYVPARNNTPNSAEILDSKAMRRFVEALSKNYDLVIIDTPPIMAVSDARIVAQIVDYIVFLIRWEQTARELAINSLKMLRDLRKPLGVVLSQVNIRRHSRYGYGDYGYYYSKYRNYYHNK
jgi:polysaccharide biosynthesis transport protein